MSKPTPILGKFRITHMDEWDRDSVDAEVPGYICFDRHGQGEFEFGYVCGQMDCEQTERSGKPAVEWTFEGNDESDQITGRGWAVLQDDGSLKGKLFVHNGGSSMFTAESMMAKKAKKAGRKPRRKVRAIDAKTGESIEIDADKIKPGPIRNDTLSDPILRRIRAIHAALKGVYDLPLERMEINFMRDSHPERKVVVWENIVSALAKVMAAKPDLDRKMILKTLLAHSMALLRKLSRTARR